VKVKGKQAVRSFLIELALYSVLVVTYVFFAIRLLGDWVEGIYQQHKILYAFAALILIIGQGVVLEMVTTALLKLIRSRVE
jgi:hypothetical protein